MRSPSLRLLYRIAEHFKTEIANIFADIILHHPQQGCSVGNRNSKVGKMISEVVTKLL